MRRGGRPSHEERIPRASSLDRHLAHDLRRPHPSYSTVPFIHIGRGSCEHIRRGAHPSKATVPADLLRAPRNIHIPDRPSCHVGGSWTSLGACVSRPVPPIQVNRARALPNIHILQPDMRCVGGMRKPASASTHLLMARWHPSSVKLIGCHRFGRGGRARAPDARGHAGNCHCVHALHFSILKDKTRPAWGGKRFQESTLRRSVADDPHGEGLARGRCG